MKDKNAGTIRMGSCRRFCHSKRRASMGLSRDAFQAG